MLTLNPQSPYRCPRCQKLVEAGKLLTVHRLPPSLVLQLKRFGGKAGGGKVRRHVAFDEYLDMAPYTTDGHAHGDATPPRPYELYAVLVHEGGSLHSGHYYAYVKPPSGVWHQMDDEKVRQVAAQRVRHFADTCAAGLRGAPGRRGARNPRLAPGAAQCHGRGRLREHVRRETQNYY